MTESVITIRCNDFNQPRFNWNIQNAHLICDPFVKRLCDKIAFISIRHHTTRRRLLNWKCEMKFINQELSAAAFTHKFPFVFFI